MASADKCIDNTSCTSDNSKMQQQPKDIKQLQKLAVPEIVDKWDSIAIQLGFNPVQIGRIEENHQERPVERSCQKMLWGWLDSSPKSSELANNLIKAINDVEYVSYAEEFKKDMKSGTDILNYKYLDEKVIPRVAVKWNEIGIQLNIPSFRLDNIRQETDHVSQRCQEMLQMWLQRGSSVQESHRPTWENLYKAMIAIELIAPAERLKERVLKL